MSTQENTDIAKRRDSMLAGRESSDYMMKYVIDNFGASFASEEDKTRFCAGVAAELMRSPKLRDILRASAWARQQMLVILASCMRDGHIPSTHTMITVRGHGDDTVLTRDDLLEGCLALMEKHGYRAQRPQLVYEGDEFEQRRSITNGKCTFELHHVPKGEDDPNKITGCYLPMERISDGYTDWVYAPRNVFDAAKKSATRWLSDKGKAYSPWYQHFGEMCQKHLAKRAVRYMNKVPMLDTEKSHMITGAVADMLDKSGMTEEQQAELQENFLTADRDDYSDETTFDSDAAEVPVSAYADEVATPADNANNDILSLK